MSDRLNSLDTVNGRRLLWLAVVAMAAVIGLLIVKPSIDATHKSDKAAAAAVAQNSDLQDELGDLREAASKGGKKIRNRAAEIKKALPKQVSSEYQYVLLTNLAKATNVEMPTFQPGTVTPQTGYSKLPVNIVVKGSLQNLMRFLGGLYGMVSFDKQGLNAVGPIWYVDTIGLSPESKESLTLNLSSGNYLEEGASTSTTTPSPSPSPSTATPPPSTPNGSGTP